MRDAIFKPTDDLVGKLLQETPGRIDGSDIPKLSERPEGSEFLMERGMFGALPAA